MATAAKSGTTEKTAVPPAKKSMKMLFIIIAAVLLIGGGATAYMLMKPVHAAAKDVANDAAAEQTSPSLPPKYVALGTFTANLIHEEGDRYLQVSISIKVSRPGLEDEIKARNPEILHTVNMLLESKSPSELATVAGKEKLARDLKFQIEKVLGFHKTAPDAIPTQSASAPVSAPVSAPAMAEPAQVDSGIEEVLFTSFIIQ
jgi:flagellar FliL protein